MLKRYCDSSPIDITRNFYFVTREKLHLEFRRNFSLRLTNADAFVTEMMMIIKVSPPSMQGLPMGA